MFILNLTFLTIIIIYIIDLSGIISSIKKGISYILTKGKIVQDTYSLKPFDCSLCMTFWVNIIYSIHQNQFTIPNITIICILSFLTIPIKDALLGIYERLLKLANKL